MFSLRNKQSKRNGAVGLDIGRSRIKAASLQRQGDKLQLAQYLVVPSAVPVGKAGAEQQFGQELQQVMSRLNASERHASVAISCNSAIVCEAEFPRMPLEEAKNALKLNSSRYLRRDFTNYYLDAVEVAEVAQDSKAKKSGTMKLLVGGANKDEVRWYRDALLAAKIRPEAIELAAVSVINAFQISHREDCEKDVVLLVDIGAHSTSINFLRGGQPRMTRIMHFGGAQISEYVGQMLTLDSAAAEEEKLKMSEPVQSLVKTALLPLAREMRSSIDFFERQQECHVNKAFAGGGSACGKSILNFLSEEVGLRIECWNPVVALDISHFNGEMPELEIVAPSLAAAIGVAATRV